MSTLIVAFPKLEEAKAVRNLFDSQRLRCRCTMYKWGTGN